MFCTYWMNGYHSWTVDGIRQEGRRALSADTTEEEVDIG